METVKKKGVSPEKIITLLFVLGFKEIDDYLYNFFMIRLTNSESFFKRFRFDTSSTNQVFKKYVERVGNKYRLIKGYSVKSNIFPTGDNKWSLERTLNDDEALWECVQSIDLGEVVLDKAKALGAKKISDDPTLLSKEEWDIIKAERKKRITKMRDIIYLMSIQKLEEVKKK